MYFHQSLLSSQDDFDDDDGGVSYRHIDPRSSLNLAPTTQRNIAPPARHSVSRSSYSQRRSRPASPLSSGGSRWEGRGVVGSGFSAFAPSQPPPTSRFALPSRFAVKQQRDEEEEEGEEDIRDEDRELELERKEGHDDRREDWDEDADASTPTDAHAHHGTSAFDRHSLPSRPSLFAPAVNAQQSGHRSPQALAEDNSKWSVADETTTRLLQRAKVWQEQSDEDFFWSDPIVVKEEGGGQRAVAGKMRGATLTAASLTDRQKKERVYAQKLQNQDIRVKRVGPVRESNLATLSRNRQTRAALTLTQSQRPAASSSHHHFSAQLEADLSVKRLVVNKSLEVEDADAPSPISEEALAAGRAMAAEREQKDWRNQLDAQLDASTLHPSVAAHAQPQSHSRRSKKRGGLEEQLERVLRMRNSLHTRYTSEQERLIRSEQQASDALTADTQGCVRAVIVKLVATVEHYSLTFAVGVLCSAYKVAEADGFAPVASVQQLDTALPSLQRAARALRVDVGRLALLVLNAQQRQAMHVPEQLSAPIYVRLTWPWFDVGERMGVFGHVLLDMFDCAVIDSLQGAAYERQEEQRWEAEREQRESDARRQIDAAEQQELDAPNALMDDVELRKKQDALRETFGDLTEPEVASLFEDEGDTKQQLSQSVQAAAVAVRHPFSAYRRLPLSSVTPYTSLWYTCLVGIVRKVSLHGHNIESSDPNSRVIQHQLLPSLLLDDGTALIQVELSLRCVERWRDVLLRGEGNVIWIGAARVNETPSSGLGVRDGLRQLLADYGYKGARGLRVLRVDDRSRYVMKAQHEQTLLSVSHAPHRITPLLSLLTASDGKQTARVHVHVKVLHIEWENDDSCVVWASDSSLMPSAANCSHPLPPTTVIVHFTYHLHVQQLRAFVHSVDEQSNSLLIRDLVFSASTSAAWPLQLTADTYTELCAPRVSEGASVEGFEQTVVYERLRRQLRVATRLDVFSSCSVSMAEQLVPPFTPLPSRLSLSSLLTPTALHGYTASPLLQRYGLFDVEGVVMTVHTPALLSRQCSECGYLSPYQGSGRRSGGLHLSAYCRRCHTQSSAAHAVVGRVWVDVQCSDIHMLHTVRMLLSSGEVSRCLQGRSAMDGAAANVLALLQDEGVVREQLMSKRVQCVCRCEQPSEASVRAQELQLLAVEPNKDLRARS